MRFALFATLDPAVRHIIKEAPYILASDIVPVPNHVLVIEIDGVGRVPAFQLTDDSTWLSAVRAINELLLTPEVCAKPEPPPSKSVVEWWFTPNSKLAGAIPYMLAGEPANSTTLLRVARESLQLTLPPLTTKELQKATLAGGNANFAGALSRALQQPVIPYDVVMQNFELPNAPEDLLIILHHPNGTPYCPAFQFDFERCRPRSLVMVINHAMGTADGDDLAVAGWWQNGNSYIEGERTPASLLDTLQEAMLPDLSFITRYDP